MSNTQPNILIFMTDQQRGCSVLPNDQYKAITPNLDAFRGTATTFTRAYTASPHCCPSRASFMTGLMPTEHGVWNNVAATSALSRGLRSSVVPWSVDLKAAGYQVLFSGKWHVSNHQTPSDYGWEQVFPDGSAEKPECVRTVRDIEGDDREVLRRERIRLQRTIQESDQLRNGTPERAEAEIMRVGMSPFFLYGSSDHPFLSRYFRADPDSTTDGGDQIGGNPFNDTTVVDHAIESMTQLEDGPWCMFVGTLGPHDPYIPPRRFLDLYSDRDFELPDTFQDSMHDKPGLYRRTQDLFRQIPPGEHREAIRHYLAFCSYEDWLFGRLLEKLKERGEYSNTLVVYVSDHGDYMGDHGLWAKGLPSFLSCYHVPAIVKAPGQRTGGVRTELVSLLDFAPTILHYGGVGSEPDRFTGQSLVPLLECTDARSVAWRDALFFQTNGNEAYGMERSVLTDRWRFVHNRFDYDELYDLWQDPGQMTNLAGLPEYRRVTHDLYRRMWKFGLAHEEHLLNDYIMTALADVGPGIAIVELEEQDEM